MFEVTVSAPGGRPEDLYLEHQMIWTLLGPTLSKGTEFLYRAEGRGTQSVFLVRSRSSVWGARPAVLPKAGTLSLTMVCARRNGHEQRPISNDEEARPWVREALEEAGFEISDLVVGPQDIRRGVKRQTIHIWVPVREIQARFRVTNYEKAYAAFCNGIGRQKRFGFGLIKVARI